MKPTRLTTQALLTAAALAPASLASAAISDINSLVLQERLFNDFPGTTLTIVDNDLSSLSITESDFVDDGQGGNFTNRHVAWLSEDNVNPRKFVTAEGFDFSVDVNLTAVEQTPAKEAGIYLETFIGGTMQFIVKTGTGEIAAFGGGFPGVSSTNDGSGNGLEFDGRTYNDGETVNMRVLYTPGDGAGGSVPATVEYFIDDVSSGVLDFGNLENGVIPDSQLGVYGQFPPDILFAIDNTVSAVYSNFSITPLLTGAIEGDYDDGGQVEQTDLDFVLSNWGDTDVSDVTAWINFPGGGAFDGLVDQNELDGVLLNWGSTSAPDFSGSSVPEPAALGFVAALGLVARRRTA